MPSKATGASVADANPFADHPPARIDTALTLDEYHAGPGLSRSPIWRFVTDGPGRFHWKREKGLYDFESDPMRLGSAGHAALYEPDTFDTLFVVWNWAEAEVAAEMVDSRPKGWDDAKKAGKAPRRAGKAYDHFLARAKSAGLTVLTEEQHQKALLLRDYVSNQAGIRSLWSTGAPEVSMFWTDFESGQLLKSRPDWLDFPRKRAVDLKVAGNLWNDDGTLNEWRLMDKVKKQGIHVQFAMFQDAARELGEQIDELWILWVCVDDAPIAIPRRLPEEAIDEGRRVYLDAVKRYAECERTGVWPMPHFKPDDMPWQEAI